MALARVSILGCGYLGFPLALRLLEKGYEVSGSTTSREKLPPLKAVGIQPFLLQYPPPPGAEADEAFFESDLLFLNIPFRRQLRHPREYQTQIRCVLDRLKKGTISWVIFASSTSVYPKDLKEAGEETVFQPVDERARVLLDVEQDVRHAGYKTTILRFAGLYGHSRQIDRFLSGKAPAGSGSSPVNLVHLDDAVMIAEQMIEKNAEGGIFNVCSDRHPTRQELYTAKAQALGVPPPEFDAKARPAQKTVSNRKIKEKLSYTFIHPDPRL